MEVIIRHLGNVQFEAEARGHRYLCDQPETNGGEDSGMTPPEFLLASLGTCAGFYVAQYLKFHNLPLDRLTVRVTASKAQAPARLGAFRIEVDAPEVNGGRHEEGIRRAVEKCLVHNTLLHPPQIETVIRTGATAGAGI